MGKDKDFPQNVGTNDQSQSRTNQTQWLTKSAAGYPLDNPKEIPNE
jgi:hypothetical protein